MANELRFKNRMEAIKYLGRLGYHIGRSKFYQDCDRGVCTVEQDKSILESSLMRYIKHPQSNLKKFDTPKGDLVADQKRSQELSKIEEETRILKIKRKALEGRYIDRDQVYLELAARAAVFEHGFRHWWNMNAAKLVELVTGDPENARDLVLDAGLRGVDEQVNEFARADTFKVVFGKEIDFETEKENAGTEA